MKHLCMCAVALAMGVLIVVPVGCDQAAQTTQTAIEAGSAVASDKLNQLEKYLKDNTVLERARVQLANAKRSRVNLKETADKFNVDAEVALKQIKRLEDEKAKVVENFTKLYPTTPVS